MIVVSAWVMVANKVCEAPGACDAILVAAAPDSGFEL